MRMSLILLLFLLCSCSRLRPKSKGRVLPHSAKVERYPSSDTPGSCTDLLAENLRIGHNLKAELWDKDTLVRKGIINLEEFNSLKLSEQWGTFIKEAGSKSEDEQLMAITILSILKRKYPGVSELNLKERFRVLLQFCG